MILVAPRGSPSHRTPLRSWAGLAALLAALVVAACSTTAAATISRQEEPPTQTSTEKARPVASEATAAGVPAGAPFSPAAQTNEGGQVTVEVSWSNPSGEPVFQVTMNTHSVDLDRVDLRQLALLRTDQGREARPSGWDAAPGGHHRAGTLAFPTTTADGSPLIEPTTRTVELTMSDVAGVPERVFRWTR